MASRTLQVVITGDTKGLSKGIQEAEGSVSSFSSKLGGLAGQMGIALGGVAVLGFAKKSIDAFQQIGAETLKLQRYIGGTPEAVSRLRTAFELSGVPIDVATKSLGLFEKKIVTSKDTVKDFGIVTKDSSGHILPMNDILLSAADRFAKLPPGAERSALAMQMFGKQGMEMVKFLSKGRDGIIELEKESDKYGLTLTGKNMDAVRAAIAAHHDQEAAMKGLEVQIGEHLLPIMTSLTTFMADNIPKATDAVGTAFSIAAGPIGVVTEAFGLLPDQLQGGALALGTVGIAAVTLGPKIADLAGDATDLATKGWGMMKKAGSDVVSTFRDLRGGSDETGGKFQNLESVSKGVRFAVMSAALIGLGILFQRVQQQASDYANKIASSASGPVNQIKAIEAEIERLKAQNEGEAHVGPFWWSEDAAHRENAIKALQGKEKDLQNQQDATTASAKAEGDALKGVAGSADEQNSALTKAIASLEGYSARIKGLYTYQLMGRDANIAFQQSIADINKAFWTNTFTLDLNTQQGRDNIKVADGIRDSLIQVGQATFSHTGSTKAATQAVNQHILSLYAQMMQLGYTKDQVDQLVAAEKLTPADIATYFHANTNDASANIDGIHQQIDKVPKHVQVQIDLVLANYAGDWAKIVGYQVQGAAYNPATDGHRAGGGPIQKGRVYTVNEDGEEWMKIPGGQQRIIAPWDSVIRNEKQMGPGWTSGASSFRPIDSATPTFSNPGNTVFHLHLHGVAAVGTKEEIGKHVETTLRAAERSTGRQILVR
jgi:hypothetical protein